MLNKICFIILLFIILPLLSKAQTGTNCEEITDKKAIKNFEEAQNLFKKKQYAEATMYCKKALEFESAFADPKYMLAEINIKKENIFIAKKYLQEVLEICPNFNVYTYFWLGQIAYGDKDYEKAYNYMKEFLKDVDKIKNDDDFKLATEYLNEAKFYKDGFSKSVPFDPKPVMNICTTEDEYLGSLTADNETMYFTRKEELPKSRSDLFEHDYKTYKEKFMFAARGADGLFDKGQEMPYPFNQSENTGAPTLTIDNTELFCTLCKDKYLVKSKRNYYNCDIYTSKFINGVWSDLEPLPAKINLPDTWESQPSISSDGKTLYFVSNRPGGVGGYDIYKATRNDNGTWDSVPENLGPTINTQGNEKSPFIHTDRQTLYFSSSDRTDAAGNTYPGHKGFGGYDIFFTKLKEDGSWSIPQNIGYPINSEQNDFGFFVSTDGKTAFFSADTSRRLKGVGGMDLFSFELYKAARPEKVLFLKGNVKDEATNAPTNVDLEIQNVKTKKITRIPVDSTTGKYAAALVFKDDYLMTLKKENYSYDYKYLSVNNDSSKEKMTDLDFEMKKIEVGKSYKINDIYFSQNSYELMEESKFVLDQFADFLKENHEMAVSIQGHTDNLWSDEYNLTLSINRAKAVRDYLISKGINPSRLSYEGFGKTRPVATNDTPEGRAKNRRTEFVIIKK